MEETRNWGVQKRLDRDRDGGAGDEERKGGMDIT